MVLSTVLIITNQYFTGTLTPAITSKFFSERSGGTFTGDGEDHQELQEEHVERRDRQG